MKSVFSLRPLPGRRSAKKRKQGGSVLPIHVSVLLLIVSLCSLKHILRQGVSLSTFFTCFFFRSTLTNDKLPIHNSPGWRDFKVQLKDCYKSWHGWYRGVVQLVFRKQIGCSREKQVKNWMQWAGTGQRWWVNPPRYTSWLIGILLSCNGRGENFSNSFQLNQNISINELFLHQLD